uniref:Uncharacterized protein n=1 Tax=viral metagenome TaxID=1070528 RepID=A0A6C0L8U0_9ZZZZ
MSHIHIKETRAKLLARILSLYRQAQLKQSSSPDVELIRALHERVHTDNPMFRLSIEEYEYMCKNDIVLTMMAKILETDVNKLKKICKHLHIFKEYINSSPETIKNKMKAQKLAIKDLPDDIKEKVVKIYENILKYELRDWISLEKLDMNSLSYNPDAIDLLDKYPDKIDWQEIASNPNNEGSVRLIRKYIFGNNQKSSKSNSKYKKFANDIDWAVLSSNPYAIDLLEAIIKEGGADATNNRVDWYLFSSNKEAIPILSKPEYRKHIDWAVLSSNPSAIDLLKDKWEEDKQIKRVDVEQYNNLKDYENIVAWNILSGNPNAIDLLRKKIRDEKKMSPEDYDSLEDNEKIAWDILSANSEAIALLEKNPDKIVWLNLSSNQNPKAIKLLKERVEYENSLSIEEYRKLSNKVNWLFLSNNPNVIKILEDNIDKIVWTALSNNQKAIKLLEANQDKIDWATLSGNPEAMSLLEANQDKIEWTTLSRNPKAMSLLEANQDKIVWEELSINPGIFILQ